jgi:ubiquinone/menaquinone biosynthesis C-methylase UbiE
LPDPDRLDPRRRFEGGACGYARHRPGYPEPLVDWVIDEAAVGAGDPAADVGCGTGILTRMLDARGLRVVGIDPGADMLAQARAAGEGAEYRTGEAAATGLPDHSVALVTVAQAFHWFDLDAALAEFHRVLRPGGHVAAIWNIRGESPFMGGYDALLRRFSSQYAVLDSWEATRTALTRHPRAVEPRESREAHAQRFDFEAFRGRAWSSSYVRHGVADAAAFDAALRTLFDHYARDAAVDFPYQAVALVFGVS